jgi:hypothetical protein
MQTFRFAKVIRYHEGTNKKSAFIEFIPHNHYQAVYLYFSVFQLVITNCFSIYSFDFSFFIKVVMTIKLTLTMTFFPINQPESSLKR